MGIDLGGFLLLKGGFTQIKEKRSSRASPSYRKTPNNHRAQGFAQLKLGTQQG